MPLSAAISHRNLSLQGFAFNDLERTVAHSGCDLSLRHLLNNQNPMSTRSGSQDLHDEFLQGMIGPAVAWTRGVLGDLGMGHEAVSLHGGAMRFVQLLAEFDIEHNLLPNAIPAHRIATTLEYDLQFRC
eukprot:gnl/MRDRNA2_/MRDRNA2_281306_c0_seq1.p1 gnl/MRDRNA2_/MRDRNA2_281306_c0~~gnl/MRDRNA2_/MRDRNA2_281306_c0_seq1.p1  ORF type:complete len:129 (+),score=14.88 gnl/MRDRNA2_/MRDRNA2_281306_c0_seq1:201-587(+)